MALPSPRRTVAAAAALLTALTPILVNPVAAPAAAAATTATPASTPPDYCLGECSDILPPGQNGHATFAEILLHQLLGTMPRHSDDQIDKYADLVHHYTGLSPDQINTFFNDASFGVPPGQVARSYSPRSDVTIVRDRALGVPHITGSTRAGTMFGAGYAGAEDRLFLMDLMRHVGRGQVTSFAGGAPGNRALEQSVWRTSPYPEADLEAQVEALRQQGPRGQQLWEDTEQYIAGVNAYIADCMAGRYCAGEYVLTGHLDPITNAGGPEPFVPADVVAISGVIGGLFGGGGGREMESALVRVAAGARYGPELGDQVWEAFRSSNDPETVLTLNQGQSFPYGQGDPDAASVALPDAGTVTPHEVVHDPTGSARQSTTATTGAAAAGVLPGLSAGGQPHGMSNAVVISAEHSATGHPIAVWGPQTGYFSPQLLMLQELQGPGISTRGVAFAGLNLYTLLGRGPDYAWSATSGTQDITDTYAVPLCEPDGTDPTVDSEHYLFHGECLAMERLERHNSWRPSLADPTPPGSYRLVMLRTNYGLVTWRGLVDGEPTAFTSLRSTYRHEADSAIGFQMFNDPEEMGTAAAFRESASHISFAFNWFYINASDAAYFLSGAHPVRPDGVDPNLPTRALPEYEWVDWDPATNRAAYLPPAAHPQAVNQDYFISWNNKQAEDFSAADGNFSFSAVHRGDLLDVPVRERLAAGESFDRASLVELVQEAGLVDLRGAEVLEDLLRVIDTDPVADPALAAAVEALRDWQRSGALRKETPPGSRTYAHAEAIRILDAWWPLLVSGQFRPGLGDDLYFALVDTLSINESPSGLQQGDASELPGSANEAQAHRGSAFQYGWWGWVSKDIRTVLGEDVPGALPVGYCGDGALAACREVLLATLAEAVATPASETYPGDEHCAAADQWCADTIVHSALGGINQKVIHWQNRPTYQMVMSFPAHRGDDVSNLAAGRSVTASSTQLGRPARNAVDGDLGTRWSSAWRDNQWLTVDLGSVQQVGRVILRWEAAYATGYRIEVSDDGVAWRTVWSTTAGNGGVDNLTFAATDARYVRMYGVSRATGYGFSLWEFEVYPR